MIRSLVFARYFTRGPALRLLAALLVMAGCATGCSRWNWRGEGFSDDSPRWGEKLRKPGPREDGSALSTKGSEIEHDLGYR